MSALRRAHTRVRPYKIFRRARHASPTFISLDHIDPGGGLRAQGYYETPQEAYQPEATRQFYTNPYMNPETEQEYRRRIWWENYETEWPRFFRR